MIAVRPVAVPEIPAGVCGKRHRNIGQPNTTTLVPVGINRGDE